jgi:hypothetical protein
VLYLAFYLKNYAAWMIVVAGLTPWSWVYAFFHGTDRFAFWYALGRYGEESTLAVFGLTTWFLAVLAFAFASTYLSRR